MLKFMSILFLSITLFSCTEAPQILQSACNVTNDICNYAALICNNLPEKNITANQEENYLLRLIAINNLLKSEFQKTELEKLNKLSVDLEDHNDALILARNQLKKICDELEKK